MVDAPAQEEDEEAKKPANSLSEVPADTLPSASASTGIPQESVQAKGSMGPPALPPKSDNLKK